MSKYFFFIVLILFVLFALLGQNRTNQLQHSIKPTSKNSSDSEPNIESRKVLKDEIQHEQSLENDKSKQIMSDEEFISHETYYAKTKLDEDEVGLCFTIDKSACIPYREIFYQNNQVDEKCFAKRKNCKDNSFVQVSSEELLSVMEPDQVVDYLIDREKTENYIKDPVANGSDMYDKNWYDMKLANLRSVSPVSPESN